MSIRSRLHKLEGVRSHPTLPHDYPDGPIREQAEQVLDSLYLHRLGGSVQATTDRQVHLMGLLCAQEKLEGRAGIYRFPSAVEAYFEEAEGHTQGVHATGVVGLEDLPEGVRKYFRRMDPARQPAREAWLYENRRLLRQQSPRHVADRGEGGRS